MNNSVFQRFKKLGTRQKPENDPSTSKSSEPYYQSPKPGTYSSDLSLSGKPYYKTDPYQQLALLDEYQSPVVPRAIIDGPNNSTRRPTDPSTYIVPSSTAPQTYQYVDPRQGTSLNRQNQRQDEIFELANTAIEPGMSSSTSVPASRHELPVRTRASTQEEEASSVSNADLDVDSWITPALSNLRKTSSPNVRPENPFRPSVVLSSESEEFSASTPPSSVGQSSQKDRSSLSTPNEVPASRQSRLPYPPTSFTSSSVPSSSQRSTAHSRQPTTSSSTPVLPSSSNSEPRTEYNPPSIVIIVMGLTGAGKSRFVKEATGLDVDVGHSLISATAEITPYEVSFGNRYGFLIDTPGFDDTHRTDVEIFRDVADWLARQYANHELLTSVIYVHRITDSRVAGSALRNMTVMKKMLGVESFRNLVLVTSMWDLVEPGIGEKREQELSDKFWKDLIRAGAHMQRFSGDRRSALRILEGMRSEAPVTLTIQRELVDDGIQLDRTTAGTYLEREMIRSNAQEANEFYLHAQQLNKASDRQSQTESVISQGPVSTASRSNASLRAYWNAGSRTLNQGSASSTQYKQDPRMYAPFEWEDHFRLVSLRAGSGASPIEISLMMARVLDPPEFIALSYVVGRESADASINFRRDRWLSQLYVTPTLREAMQQLRAPDTDLLIWIDAISINQDDLEERARQVRMMGQIFRAALGVCIWLGSATDGGDDAMDFIHKILDFEVLEDLVTDDRSQQKWLLLAKLMSRPWFRRRWVVQEIMFARDAMVHCGDRVVEWNDFRDAATLFRTRWPDIQRHMNERALAELGDAHLLGAIALIEISQSVFRRDAEGNILERLLTTEDLLSLLPMFEATDLLDTVYAILDMANDMRGENAVTVNYEQQPAELFRDTVRLIVTSSGSLDIICRPWAPISGLPSWITTISKHRYKRRVNRQQYDRQNGVSLVGMPGNTFYRACGVMRATAENTSFRAEGDQQVLAVTGIVAGSIVDLGDRSMNGNIPQEWMSLAAWHSIDDAAPVAFWKTLVANRALNGNPAPDWYGRACEFAFRKSTTGDIDTTFLIRSILSSHVQEFLNRVLDVTWRRKFAVIKEKDSDFTRFALCPPETELGDTICILYGCSVPIVLRRVGSYHRVVGECFVYGIMDGEAVGGDSRSVTMFEIV